METENPNLPTGQCITPSASASQPDLRETAVLTAVPKGNLPRGKKEVVEQAPLDHSMLRPGHIFMFYTHIHTCVESELVVDDHSLL